MSSAGLFFLEYKARMVLGLFVYVCVSRWAQFFICPLMIEDAIDREVEAVDSGECLPTYI